MKAIIELMTKHRKIYFRYKSRKPGQEPQLYFPGFGENSRLYLRGSLREFLNLEPKYYSLPLPKDIAEQLSQENQFEIVQYIVENRNKIEEEPELTTLFNLEDRYMESKLLREGITKELIQYIESESDGPITVYEDAPRSETIQLIGNSKNNTITLQKDNFGSNQDWIKQNASGYNFGIILCGLIFETKNSAVLQLQPLLQSTKTTQNYDDVFSTIQFLVEHSEDVSIDQFFKPLNTDQIHQKLNNHSNKQWLEKNIINKPNEKETH